MSRKILKAERFATGYGTHKYEVEYEGEWEDWELITAIDNQKWEDLTEKDLTIRHYGGWVKRLDSEEKPDKAIVHVYYD